MNAQEIFRYIDKIHTRIGFAERIGMLEENWKLFDELYELAATVEPYDKYRDGEDRMFWIHAPRGTYEEFAETFQLHFTETTIEDYFAGKKGVLNVERMKSQWPVMFPDETCWFKLYLAKHCDVRGLHMEGDWLVDTRDRYKERMDMEPLLQWMIDEVKECIEMIKEGTYGKFLEENLPYKHRSGIVDSQIFWKYVPEDRDHTLRGVDPKEWDEFLAWLDEDELSRGWTEMCAGDYFKACDLLYDELGLKEKFPIIISDNPTPRDFYIVYSDGRDMGPDGKHLREIDEDSAEVFARWVEKGALEEHAWEICLTPLLILRPEKMKDKYFLSLYEHHLSEYGSIIHLQLALLRAGFPIRKTQWIADRLMQNQKFGIQPLGDEFAWRYTYENKIELEDYRNLPELPSDELIQAIEWIPLGEWKMKN
ncbi:MAG: hypothetical protein J6A73_05940 [Lachnospiraceae bacterium]|nr:hypothetical protein [Lachnospiraceae bacterium]